MVQFCYYLEPNCTTSIDIDPYSALLVIDWEGRDDAKCRSHGKRYEQHFTKRYLLAPASCPARILEVYRSYTGCTCMYCWNCIVRTHAWFDVKVKKNMQLAVLTNKRKGKYPYILSLLQIIRHTRSVKL